MKINLRAAGVDTPETKRASDLEEEAGRIVTSKVIELIGDKIVPAKLYKWGTYGGRIIGDVYLPSNESLSEYLIKNRLGKPYDGKAKKKPWSEKDLKYIINNRDKFSPEYN